MVLLLSMRFDTAVGAGIYSAKKTIRRTDLQT